MGMIKWVLIVLVLLLPSGVNGLFISDLDISMSIKYSPENIPFPVSFTPFKKLPAYDFQIIGKTLVIKEKNSNKYKYLDTTNGNPASMPPGFEESAPLRGVMTGKGNIFIQGNPPFRLLRAGSALVLDNNRWLEIESSKDISGITTYTAKYFVNSFEKGRFEMSEFVFNSLVIDEENICLKGSGRIFLYNIKTGKKLDVIVDPWLYGNPVKKNHYLLIGSAVVDLDNYSLTYLSSNACYYKDYLLCFKSDYDRIDKKYTTSVKICTYDNVTISTRTIEDKNIIFYGSTGNIAYGSYVNDHEYCFYNVPMNRIDFTLDSTNCQLIGDDGENVLLWQGGEIVCISGKNGKKVWSWKIDREAGESIVSSKVANNRMYLNKQVFFTHEKVTSCLCECVGDREKTILEWQGANNGTYNNIKALEVFITDTGLIKVPAMEKDVPIELFDLDGKPVKQIAIPEIMQVKYKIFLYDKGFLYCDCNGQRLFQINLDVGSHRSVKTSDITNDNPYPYMSLKIACENVICQNNKNETVIIGLEQFKVLKKIEDFKPDIINGNLLFDFYKRKVYAIKEDKLTVIRNSAVGPRLGDRQAFFEYGKKTVSFVGQDGGIVDSDTTLSVNDAGWFSPVFGDICLTPSSAVSLVSGEVVQDMSNFQYIQPLVPDGGCFFQDISGIVWKTKPAPSYSIKKLDDETFEILNTRTDGKTGNLIGKAVSISWSDDGKFPVVTDIPSWSVFNPIEPGGKATFKLKTAMHGKFAIVVESNGFLDTRKNGGDKTHLPQFDGFRSVDPEKILSVSVWDGQ